MAYISMLPSGKYRAHIHKRGSRATASFRTKKEALNWAALAEQQAEHRYQSALRFNALRVDKSPAYFGCGVYFLYQDAEIIYVGKSTNVFNRIASHASKGRKFTHYSVLPCALEDLDRLEREHIDRLKPVQNRV